jgi:prepilin-type N-terminal cleavage/methylation domain-containing protein
MMRFRSIRCGGFTLIELLVVVSITVLLLAILTSSLRRAREHARRVQCASNLKQLGLSVAMYADAYDDWMPQAADHRDPNSQANWYRNTQLSIALDLPSNRQHRSAITCPSDADPGTNTAEFLDDRAMDTWLSYGMNVAFGSGRTDALKRRKRLEFNQPGRTMVFMDAYAYGNAIGEAGWQACLSLCDAYRHDGSAQAVFLDQHVGKVSPLAHSCDAQDIDFSFWGCYWLKPSNVTSP